MNLINETKCPKCGSMAKVLKHSETTLVYWPQEYDENGSLLSKNPNITTHHWVCGKCGEHYDSKD